MKRKAFSLIEMVMVIVVLGIVAMIGTNILAHMYEGYIRTKITNSLQAKTTHVLDLISKRLSYRIKDSLVTSKNGNIATYLKLSDPTITTDHNILEWIGYDNEGFIGEWAGGSSFRGWNGFVDLDNAGTGIGTILTSGSRLDLTKDTISALSYKETNLSTMTVGSSAAIIFQCNSNMEPISYGYLGGTHSNVWRTNILANDQLNVQNPDTVAPIETNYCERYSLAWSAYAIAPEGTDPNDFNLTLKYNYQPWENERYNTSSTKSAVLSEHVTTFRFIQLGHTLRVKLCIKDPQLDFAFCKEKAIF